MSQVEVIQDLAMRARASDMDRRAKDAGAQGTASAKLSVVYSMYTGGSIVGGLRLYLYVRKYIRAWRDTNRGQRFDSGKSCGLLGSIVSPTLAVISDYVSYTGLESRLLHL